MTYRQRRVIDMKQWQRSKTELDYPPVFLCVMIWYISAIVGWVWMSDIRVWNIILSTDHIQNFLLFCKLWNNIILIRNLVAQPVLRRALLLNLPLVPLDLPRDCIDDSPRASLAPHPVEAVTAVYLEAVWWEVLYLWPIDLAATKKGRVELCFKWESNTYKIYYKMIPPNCFFTRVQSACG